ncbi:MAG: TPM domain-containing protein [Clostridia bacterium]|nr:TPM domain-containing protein [Clostridia bacterium]
MRNLKRPLALTLALLTVFTLLSLFVLSSSAAGTYFDDSANVLSSSRGEDIERRLKEVSDRHGCPVMIVTVNGQSDSTYEKYAIALANDLDGRYGKAVLLVQFPDIRAYMIEIRGSAFPTDQVKRAFNKIEDAVLECLREDDYYGAYKAFASTADYCLEALIAGKTVREPYPAVRNIIIAVIAGLIVALIYTGSLKKQLKTVRQDNRAANYVKAGSLNVTLQQDIFLYTHTTRTARPKNNGGGGGGFSSGGGRSSGGGGGGHY